MSVCVWNLHTALHERRSLNESSGLYREIRILLRALGPHVVGLHRPRNISRHHRGVNRWASGLGGLRRGMRFSLAYRPPMWVSLGRSGRWGYAVQETAQLTRNHDPIPGLLAAMRDGPVILGPLSLGLLPYNPYTRGEKGADHYVLAHAVDVDHIVLHDPWGFPCIRITVEHLRWAWEAPDIEYKQGYYRSWTQPRQMNQPSPRDLVDRAIGVLRQVYPDAETPVQHDGAAIGADALNCVAHRYREGQMSALGCEFLTGFSLPLAARRALDHAIFLNPYHPKLAKTLTKKRA